MRIESGSCRVYAGGDPISRPYPDIDNAVLSAAHALPGPLTPPPNDPASASLGKRIIEGIRRYILHGRRFPEGGSDSLDA